MYQLRKLSEIKNYRAYENFKWDESVNCFSRNNLIYGWNASGKSSIADLLLDISRDTCFEDDTEFKFLFQNESSLRFDVTNSKTSIDKYSLRVYDQHFVERNIEKTDTLNHIFSIGEGQILKSNEIKELQTNIENLSTTYDVAQINLEKAQKKLDGFLTKTASALKTELRLSYSYNKNSFLSDFNNCTHPKKLDASTYSSIIATISSPALPEISQYHIQFAKDSIGDHIKDILKTQPVMMAISSFRDDTAISNWAATGLVLHKEHQAERCFFCDNVISETRFEILEKHFNKEFQALSEKILKAQERLNELRDEYVKLQLSFHKVGQFYPELQGRFLECQAKLSKDCVECISIIDKVKEILVKKTTNIVSNETVSEFEMLPIVATLGRNIIKDINELIEKNNSLSFDHNNVVKSAIEQAKSHWFSIYTDEFKALNAEKESQNKTYEIIKNAIEQATLAKQNLLLSSTSSSIPASIMNEELALFLGRDEIQFIDQNDGYVLKRKGKIARNLSKGEKNAIALVYFLNSLHDITIEKSETIVILDDPISSFDTNYYYYALAYIRNNVYDVGQSFIFTHKFSFYKDLCLLFKDEQTRHYIIERNSTGIHFLNESKFYCNYYDEYSYLFNRIVKYALNPTPDNDESLAIINLSRKVLESFLTFKVPNGKEAIEKVRLLSEDLSTPARAMLRLLNSKSHLQIIPDQDHTDTIELLSLVQSSVRDMLDFIWVNDPFHFKTLIEKCENIPDNFFKDGQLNFGN